MQETKFYCDNCNTEIVPEKNKSWVVKFPFLNPFFRFTNHGKPELYSLQMGDREFCEDCARKYNQLILDFSYELKEEFPPLYKPNWDKEYD